MNLKPFKTELDAVNRQLAELNKPDRAERLAELKRTFAELIAARDSGNSLNRTPAGNERIGAVSREITDATAQLDRDRYMRGLLEKRRDDLQRWISAEPAMAAAKEGLQAVRARRAEVATTLVKLDPHLDGYRGDAAEKARLLDEVVKAHAVAQLDSAIAGQPEPQAPDIIGMRSAVERSQVLVAVTQERIAALSAEIERSNAEETRLVEEWRIQRFYLAEARYNQALADFMPALHEYQAAADFTTLNAHIEVRADHDVLDYVRQQIIREIENV